MSKEKMELGEKGVENVSGGYVRTVKLEDGTEKYQVIGDRSGKVFFESSDFKKALERDNRVHGEPSISPNGSIKNRLEMPEYTE